MAYYVDLMSDIIKKQIGIIGEKVALQQARSVSGIKVSNITAIFTALEWDTESELLKDVSMFVDKEVYYK